MYFNFCNYNSYVYTSILATLESYVCLPILFFHNIIIDSRVKSIIIILIINIINCGISNNTPFYTILYIYNHFIRSCFDLKYEIRHFSKKCAYLNV